MDPSGVFVKRSVAPLMVTFASPLAVMVVGKKMVVPLGLRFGERLGETMKGDMLPILVMSSKNDPALVKGELTSVALVGRPWLVMAVKGKLLLAMAWGEGGGSVGVRGRLPVSPVGGARANGEYICPGFM